MYACVCGYQPGLEEDMGSPEVGVTGCYTLSNLEMLQSYLGSAARAASILNQGATSKT